MNLVDSIFNQSSPDHTGVKLPQPSAGFDINSVLPQALQREEPLMLPELSQLDAMRHFVSLSQLNHSIDTAFYPLGSCTMKYNPKVCDAVAQLPGFLGLHPQTPDSYAQGTLEAYYALEQSIKTITGFDAVTLQPAAGAHGELVGMMMIKAYHEHHQQAHRTQVIIPESAHGTNPATAAMCGFDVIEIPADERGLVDLEALKAALSDKTAGIMLTNPNTLGLFEQDILAITQAVHAAGGLCYYDGANLNAIMGATTVAQMGFDVMHLNTHKTFATPHGGGGPGSGPVGVNEKLLPFLPSPRVIKEGKQYKLNFDYPQSIGHVRLFWGNGEVLIRALAYIESYGMAGLKAVSAYAVLNANYLRHHLKADYDLAYDALCKHEFVLSASRQKATDSRLNALSIAKRMMDFGYHPPTIYFPLIVAEAMMFEPTETESKATLDKFITAMKTIAQECIETPDVVANAPHTTLVGKVDEVTANRNPVLAFNCCVK